jgi:tetratricopeptide (TPR) repeat protein
MRLPATFIFLFLLSFYSFSQDRAKTLIDEAEFNIKIGKYAVALAKAEEVLSFEPSNLNAMKIKIRIKYHQNDLKEALSLVETAMKRVSGDDDLVYLRGLINLGLKKYERAVSDFNILINRNTYDAMFKVYLNRGVANQFMLEYELAASDYSKSIDLNNNNPSAYHSRGMLNYQIRDYNAAIEDFIRSLQIADNNPETHFNLGMSYFRLEETDKACPHFHSACKEGNINACKMVMMECVKDLPK